MDQSDSVSTDGAKARRRRSTLVSILLVLLCVPLFVGMLYLVKAYLGFVFFHIPSGSMMPTLLVGDHIVVSKYSPSSQQRQIQRGDVVVFFGPEDPSTPSVKRIVGLPGDRVAFYNKTLYINGQSAEQEFLGYWKDPGPHDFMNGADVRLESLDGRSHGILIQSEYPSLDGRIVIPPGQYFVLGDNRDNSRDSRHWGTVPAELLIGRVNWILWNLRLPHRIGPFSAEWTKEEARGVLGSEPRRTGSRIGGALDSESDGDICIGMRYGNPKYVNEADKRGLTKERCSEFDN